MTAPSLILALCSAALVGPPPPGSATLPTETPAHARDETDARIEANVRAATFAVQTATDAASVLHALASIRPLEREMVREVVGLADQAVEAARGNTLELGNIRRLSEAERSSATRAAERLDDAHQTIRDIQGQVGVVEHIFHDRQAEDVRRDATELKLELLGARRAIDDIAAARHIATTPDRTASRRR